MDTNPGTPIAVIVFGLPGTGKSYFASRLALLTGSAYINSDRFRKELFAERTYSDNEKEMVYREMLKKTKQAIDKNTNVVLDATFHKKDIRKLFLKEIENKAEIFFIEIRANEGIIRERLRQERLYSEADFEVYKLIQQQWEPLNEPHLILTSAADNIDQMLRKAMDHLQQKDDKRSDQ